MHKVCKVLEILELKDFISSISGSSPFQSNMATVPASSDF